MKKESIQVLFVCMGNICRSPAAEGILKHMLNKENSLKIDVKSCGIGDWHLNQAPDQRIQEAAKERGVLLTSKAQQFKLEFFQRFDYILVSDRDVLKILHQYAKNLEQQAELFLMTAFSSTYEGQEIPDPYYQGNQAFELVLDMLEDCCQGLLQHIYKEHLKSER